MIRVTIELLPHGDESRKEVIARSEFWNNLSGDYKVGNYTGHFDVKFSPGDWVRSYRTFKGHDRSDSIWVLLGHMLGKEAIITECEKIQDPTEDAPGSKEPAACEEALRNEALEAEASLKEKDGLAEGLSRSEEKPGPDTVLLAMRIADCHRQQCLMASRKREKNARSHAGYHTGL